MSCCGRTRKVKGYLQNEHSDIIKEGAFVQTLHEDTRNGTKQIRLDHLSFLTRMIIVANVLAFVWMPYLHICQINEEKGDRLACQYQSAGKVVFPSIMSDNKIKMSEPRQTQPTKESYILPHNIIETQLVMSGVERNPGPEFTKVIKGSFNQGNLKFGYAAGKQCSVHCCFIWPGFQYCERCEILDSWHLG